MKKCIKKLTSRMSSRVHSNIATTTSAFIAAGYEVLRAGSPTKLLADGADFGKYVKPILEPITKYILPACGIFFAVMGIFKLIMAYRDNNPEAISTAAKDIVIGVALILFDILFSTAINGLMS